MKEDALGKSSMETARLTDRQEGPRKANPSYKRRSREPWTSADVRTLEQLAKGNTPTVS